MTVGLGGMPPVPLNAPQGAALVGGVQPGQSSGIVTANKVIVFGAAGGVFVYNGTPALGNPPIFWATSATVDPFGNVLTSTAGIAGTGTFTAGNTIVTPAGTFGYSGTPAAGNLVYSDTAAGLTDSFGNAALGGIATYFNTGSGYLAVQSFQGNLNFLNATTEAGPWNVYSSFQPNTPSGFIAYFDNTGNRYNVGHFENSGNVNQAITLTTATDVTGSVLGGFAATGWHGTWDIFYTGDQAAGTALFNLAAEGGAVVAFSYVEFLFYASSGLTERLNTTPATFNNPFAGPTLVGPGSVQRCRIEAWFTLSTGGNVAVAARCGTAGDTFHVNTVFGRVEKRQ